jgi:putative transposase
MPRRSVEIIPGLPHHVTHRAAHGARILESPHAKAVLMRLLTKWADRAGVVVHAFALMNNHWHMSATPRHERSLAKMVGYACQGLSRWLNVQFGDVGPNWQQRFYASPMDPEHAVAAGRYIERNPVAAGLVERAEDWHWSSATWHVGDGPRPAILAPDAGNPAGIKPSLWRAMLRDPVDSLRALRIHDAARSCTPLGDESWITRLEATLGRRVRPRPRGRPRRAGPATPA